MLAALSLSLPALFCAAILVMLTPGPDKPPLTFYLALGAVVVVLVGVIALLLISKPMARAQRLRLFAVCTGAAVVSCFFAPNTLVSWPVPLWLVYRFYRAAVE